MKLWASWDWRILAEQSAERRAVIFSVSQPGNHPHNWNSVISSILPQCSQFVTTLKGEEKVAKPEVTLASIVQSPKPIELYSTTTSPTRMRSMALPSPSKSSLTEVETPKPGIQERAYTKACEVRTSRILKMQCYNYSNFCYRYGRTSRRSQSLTSCGANCQT